MAKIADIEFTGISGIKYPFEVYITLDTTLNNVEAVYIFTRRTVEKNVVHHEQLIYRPNRQFRGKNCKP